MQIKKKTSETWKKFGRFLHKFQTPFSKNPLPLSINRYRKGNRSRKCSKQSAEEKKLLADDVAQKSFFFSAANDRRISLRQERRKIQWAMDCWAIDENMKK